MKTIMRSRKAQMAVEAWFVLLFILIMLSSFWLAGPIQQSTEKSVDMNDLLLAEKALDEIADAIETAGMGGRGEKYDFVVHIPFDTVDIAYGGGKNGLYPHINMTILLYTDFPYEDGSQRFAQYSVDDNGDPSWFTGASIGTPFYYVTLTRNLSFEVNFNPFCDKTVRKPSDQVRGPGTRLRDTSGNPITFCCEAGFNLNMYAEKHWDPVTLKNQVNIKQRKYYSLPGSWYL